MVEESNTWIPLSYIVEKLESRKWSWGQNFAMKYLTINVDTRDNHATVFDRDGNCIAKTKEELDKLFDKLDKEAEKRGITYT